ncbi:MAG: hypothetical protein MK105_08875 [Crocinitomicaceae bacterium]|nr:hypothetical protein [Crocinitomicaceae bacterium]
MLKNLFLIITLFFLIACKPGIEDAGTIEDTMDTLVVSIPEEDSIEKEIISDYDMSTVDKKNSAEFKENLVKIEKEFGEQWSFCDCVVKGDSINKAFMNPNLPDDEFDRLASRLDEIDEKCQAFRIQNPSGTPEERAEHEKKVRKCLKVAGIK